MTSKKKKNSIKSFCPPFNAERQLKSKIARTMVLDSHEFLIRADLLISDPFVFSSSYLSKIYVDLLMSIESSLKSLIISLSQKDEEPEVSYGTARKNSHNIAKLYAEVELRAFRRVQLLSKKNKDELLNNAIKIKVSNRYKMVTMTDLSSDGHSRFWGDGTYSRLLDHSYIIHRLRKIAQLMHIIARDVEKKYMDMIAIKGQNSEKLFQRFQLFYQNLGGKL